MASNIIKESSQDINSTYTLPLSSTTSSKGVLEDDLGLTTDLKQLLECPVCGDIAIPPIFLCQQGHMVCHLCKGNVTKCPMCESEYTSMRNDLAESILGRCTFRCPFSEQGCFKTLKGTDVSQHFLECDYRPVACNIYIENGNPCDKLVSYSNYIHHMRNDHGVDGVDGASVVIGMSTTVKLGQGNWTFPAHYMNAFGHTFWCNLHASFNLLIAWVSFSGTKIELENYAAAITIFDPNKKWQQAKWIGQVHSIRTTAKEVYDSGNCLALLPESFVILSTVAIDEEGKKIKRWKSHFEIIEIENSKSIQYHLQNQIDNNNNNNNVENLVLTNPNEPPRMKTCEIWASMTCETKMHEIIPQVNNIENEEEFISIGNIFVEQEDEKKIDEEIEENPIHPSLQINEIKSKHELNTTVIVGNIIDNENIQELTLKTRENKSNHLLNNENNIGLNEDIREFALTTQENKSNHLLNNENNIGLNEDTQEFALTTQENKSNHSVKSRTKSGLLIIEDF